MPRIKHYTTAGVLGTLGDPALRNDKRHNGYLSRAVTGFWSLLDDDEREQIAHATARLAEETQGLGAVEAFVIVNKALARAARGKQRTRREQDALVSVWVSGLTDREET